MTSVLPIWGSAPVRTQAPAAGAPESAPGLFHDLVRRSTSPAPPAPASEDPETGETAAEAAAEAGALGVAACMPPVANPLPVEHDASGGPAPECAAPEYAAPEAAALRETLPPGAPEPAADPAPAAAAAARLEDAAPELSPAADRRTENMGTAAEVPPERSAVPVHDAAPVPALNPQAAARSAVAAARPRQGASSGPAAVDALPLDALPPEGLQVGATAVDPVPAAGLETPPRPPAPRAGHGFDAQPHDEGRDSSAALQTMPVDADSAAPAPAAPAPAQHGASRPPAPGEAFAAMGLPAPDALRAGDDPVLMIHNAPGMLHAEVAAASESRGLAAHAPSLVAAQQRLAAEAVALARVGGGQADIDLSPPELGRVRLRLAVRNRVVQGSIEVENAAVKHVLEASMDRLQFALERQGLAFERLDVRLQDSPRGGERGETPARPPRRQTHDESGRSESGGGGREPAPRSTGSGLVDYWL